MRKGNLPITTDTTSYNVGFGFGTDMKVVVYLVVLEYYKYHI